MKGYHNGKADHNAMFKKQRRGCQTLPTLEELGKTTGEGMSKFNGPLCDEIDKLAWDGTFLRQIEICRKDAYSYLEKYGVTANMTNEAKDK